MTAYVMEPLSGDCEAVLRQNEHVCIGVSPFNSYFSTERLASLARWAYGSFASFHFFVPDEITAYTFEALGYSASRSRQKARQQARYTHNKIRTAMAALPVNPGDHVLGMEQLNANPHYQELFAQVERLFSFSESFREACLDATRWVLDGKVADGSPASLEQLNLGVRYFLAELPLFAGSGYIVGAHTSLFAYHQRVRFLERFFDRELEWAPQPGQGFLVVRDGVADERPDHVLASAGSAS
ncbi:tRNA-dependent cyclodipeptide synthase [Pilimelia columellifera]|uniref:Cyclodipeptide synthase n=1 Tax=Pilimelia columellifera subsp. columellifera TaxID=706583 RepID=A0ABN3MVY1_9ACTN